MWIIVTGGEMYEIVWWREDVDLLKFDEIIISVAIDIMFELLLFIMQNQKITERHIQ